MLEGLGELHVAPKGNRPLASFSTDADGEWGYEVTLPKDPVLCGRTFVLQAVTLARGLGPFSFGQLSQGLELKLGD